MKVLAMYLPQYHSIPENNKWWGEGYTEWTAVKNAKPLFKGHIQPKEPFEDNYYDLSDETGSVWNNQAMLAKEYGIFGFCIYHYWFGNNRMLLQRPMEILLQHPEIEINYCICWANETWSRNWYGQSREVLLEQKYEGTEDYKNHFNYLLPFFKDSRYIKLHNKPIINIYKSNRISELDKIKEIWDSLAQEAGFSGVYIISGRTGNNANDTRKDIIDAYYTFEPGYTQSFKESKAQLFQEKLMTGLTKMGNKLLKTRYVEHRIDARKIYKSIIKKESFNGETVFPGSFVSWDNTPRRGFKGSVFLNTSPQLFSDNIRYLRDNSLQLGFSDLFIYINAWNEWGEGCYLEPDKVNRYDYLDAIRKVFG